MVFGHSKIRAFLPCFSLHKTVSCRSGWRRRISDRLRKLNVDHRPHPPIIDLRSHLCPADCQQPVDCHGWACSTYSGRLASCIMIIPFYSRLCPPQEVGLRQSSNFLCPLLSLSILFPVAPQCHLSNDVLVFQLIFLIMIK